MNVSTDRLRAVLGVSGDDKSITIDSLDVSSVADHLMSYCSDNTCMQRQSCLLYTSDAADE